MPICRQAKVLGFQMADMARQILDAAQLAAQSRGFHGFSFRDLAVDVGIKSASIHYHFPSKEALGASMAHRYTETLLDALGDPEDGSPQLLLARYVAVFRETLRSDGLMCLVGMLAAEIDALPAAVQKEVGAFVAANIDWLRRVLDRDAAVLNAEARAGAIFAALEGAMLVARGVQDIAAFDNHVAIFATCGLIPSDNDTF